MSKGRGIPRICPCGLDPTRYPHDLRICAPTLSRRLQKMGFYLRDLGYSNLNNAQYIMSKKSWMTAFPKSPANTYCVICDKLLYSWFC